MSNIKTITEDILLEIGGNPANKGFDGIVCAIDLINEKPELKHYTTGLYCEIAEKLNTTPTRIERAIRHEREMIFTKGNLKNINKYFSTAAELPSNSKFLSILNLHISRKMKGESDEN